LDAATAPLQRFEHVVHPWVTYSILPVFGLFNAGVAIDAAVLSTRPTAMPLGILVGHRPGQLAGREDRAGRTARRGDLPARQAAGRN